jgi:2-hydroxy-3-keto-5-methylthiopentenyl-1-phosphate phosphatase
MFFNDSSIGVEFPYIDRGCRRCANCKRWHIETIRRNGEKTVYIGDGYSDRYAIKSVDTVFARHDLANYCDTRGIAYIPFEDFYDVLKHLENGDGAI